MIPATPTLQGPNILLRPPRESDKVDRRNCVRSPEEFRMYGMEGNAIADDISDAWFGKYAGRPFHWVISFKGRCIGTARLSRIDWEAKTARFSIGIFDPSLWNKGLGAEATSLALKCAFETAELHRIELGVLEFNQRAIACYSKCGFSRVGIIEYAAFLDGKWHREIVMSITEATYRGRISPEIGG